MSPEDGSQGSAFSEEELAYIPHSLKDLQIVTCECCGTYFGIGRRAPGWKLRFKGESVCGWGCFGHLMNEAVVPTKKHYDMWERGHFRGWKEKEGS